MLTGVAEHSLTYIICGVIWALALGLANGNYACSLVHRLPRGKPLLDKTPYCGSCGTLLRVRDLFPLFSALALKHRCRYCGAAFPTSHTWTEALTGLLFILAFLHYDFREIYLPVVVLGTFLITLAAIEANDNIIMWRILLCVVVAGMILRTLADHSIFNFFMGGLYGMMIGVALNYKNIKKIGHVYMPPSPALLMAAGGICAGAKALPAFLALWFLLYLAARLLGKTPITIPFGFAAIITVMYIA